MTTRAPGGASAGSVPFGISRWPVLRDPGGNVRGYLQYLSFDIPAFFRLLVQGADVVVSEPPPTTGLVVALSSWLRRRPFVYYAADVWSEALSATDVPGVVIGIMRRVEGFVLRRAACVIAISDAVAEQVAKFGVPAERLRVVANGVDTSVFNPQGEAAASERPYFAYTGTISEWQGADVFVRALPIVQRKYPDAEIRFFGQGTDEPALRALAAEVAPGSVVFGGVVPPRQAAAWLRGAAAALVSIKPGQGYDFAKPTKIYAAAGCGTRVIFAGAGEGAAVVAGQRTRRSRRPRPPCRGGCNDRRARNRRLRPWTPLAVGGGPRFPRGGRPGSGGRSLPRWRGPPDEDPGGHHVVPQPGLAGPGPLQSGAREGNPTPARRPGAACEAGQQAARGRGIICRPARAAGLPRPPPAVDGTVCAPPAAAGKLDGGCAAHDGLFLGTRSGPASGPATDALGSLRALERCHEPAECRRDVATFRLVAMGSASSARRDGSDGGTRGETAGVRTAAGCGAGSLRRRQRASRCSRCPPGERLRLAAVGGLGSGKAAAAGHSDHSSAQGIRPRRAPQLGGGRTPPRRGRRTDRSN